MAISIHVPLAGDDRKLVGYYEGIVKISIHVPLAGDDDGPGYNAGDRAISIHVPLAGDDELFRHALRHRVVFLSTSPLRGTTCSG